MHNAITPEKHKASKYGGNSIDNDAVKIISYHIVLYSHIIRRLMVSLYTVERYPLARQSYYRHFLITVAVCSQ